MLALGTIETVGLTAAFEAADVACKSANVDLIGYELAKGGGFVTIKIEGQVGAVKAAIEAAEAAASKINRVVSVSVIPRPAKGLEIMIRNPLTRGYTPPVPEPPASSPAEPVEDTTSSTPKASAPESTDPAPAAEGATVKAETKQQTGEKSAGTQSAAPKAPATKKPAGSSAKANNK